MLTWAKNMTLVTSKPRQELLRAGERRSSHLTIALGFRDRGGGSEINPRATERPARRRATTQAKLDLVVGYASFGHF